MAQTAEVLEQPRVSKRSKVQVNVKSISPELAKQWLENMGPNRAPSQGVIDAYARMMETNQWYLNGDTIVFDTNGKMMNGMHRCNAIIKSGKTVDMIVVEGIDSAAMDTIDDGRRRSVGDHFHILNTPLPNAAISGGRWLNRIKLGALRMNKRMTNMEVVQLVQKHPGLIDSANLLKNADVVVLPAVFTAVHYIGKVLLDKPVEAQAFFDVLNTGVPSFEGDPVHVWREKVLKHVRQGTYLPASSHWFGTVHAWNAFVKREPTNNKKFIFDDEEAIEGLDISKI